MIPEEHDLAQTIADEADSLLAAGNVAGARQRYADAARLEQRALALIPLDHRRTRGILAVSLAALLHHAAHRQTVSVAERLLSEGLMPEFARAQLAEIIRVTRRQPWAEHVPLRERIVRPKGLDVIEDVAAVFGSDEALLARLYDSLKRTLIRRLALSAAEADAVLRDVFAQCAADARRILSPHAWLLDHAFIAATERLSGRAAMTAAERLFDEAKPFDEQEPPELQLGAEEEG